MKKLQLYFIVFTSLSLISCVNDSKKIPVNTMKKIVWDLQIANEFVLELKVKDSSVDVSKKTDSIFNSIMFTYGIDKKIFLENYRVYEQNPQKLAELIDSTSNYSIKKRDTIVNNILPSSALPKK
ncbi:MAG: DUF4296 domain-containing protein [Chitinophagaceae bacterium]